MSEMTIEKAIEIVTFRIDFDKKYTGKDLLLFRKAMSPNVQAFAQGFIEAHEKLEKIISLRDKQIETLREALEVIASGRTIEDRGSYIIMSARLSAIARIALESTEEKDIYERK